MALNASEFVLPGFGGNPADKLTQLSQQLWMRNMQTQRLGLMQEQKREEAGNFLRQYLNPKEYLTGSEYDPAINMKLQSVMQQGAQLASQGADIPTILQGIGPGVRDLTQYSTAAQVVDKQVKDGIQQMKENGVQGVDFDKAAYRAKAMAFHQTDPKTGQDVGLKNPQDVDLSQNWLQRAIQANPGEVTTGGDIDAFMKGTPLVKNFSDIKQYDSNNNIVSSKVHTIAPAGFVPDVDGRGVTTGMVPPHDVATEQGGSPLMHTFQGRDGKPSQAPVRLLDEDYFDNMLHQKPSIGNYLMGQVQQHWPEYEGSKPFDPDSPDVKKIARAYAYDELMNRSQKTIENAQSVVPSSSQQREDVFGTLYQQMYDRTLGRLDATADEGKIPGKANTVDSMIQIAKNNPDFLHGTPSEVDGRAVLDVSSQLPKAQLKYGPGKLDAYSNVYYDPKAQTFILKNNRNPKNPITETVPPQQLPDLLHRIAQPNSVPGGSPTATTSLKKYGYSNGAFSDVGDAPDLSGSLAADKASAIAQGLDAWQKNGEKNGAKGVPKNMADVRTPDGTLSSIDTHWFGNKYSVTLKNDKGGTTDKYFPTREAMEAYLNTSTIKSGAPTTPTAPAKTAPKPKLSTEEEQALKEQGVNVSP